jgi:hypothetical protein
MSNSMILSPKHGVNPTLVTCEICGGETNELALLGRLPDDAEAPRHVSLAGARCAACTARLVDHVACLRADAKQIRTGEVVFLAEEKAQALFQPAAVLASVLRRRICLLAPETWEALGWPRAGTPEWQALSTAPAEEGKPE